MVIYPTHIRLELEDHPDNTAWLTHLDFHLEDEAGNRYESVVNNISGSGSPDSPFHSTWRLESSYFGDTEHLTVHIAGAAWLDKGNEYAVLDLTGAGKSRGLPEHVRLADVRRNGGDRQVIFLTDQRQPMGSTLFHLSTWRDPTGEEHTISSSSFASGYSETTSHLLGIEIPPGWNYTWFTLEDCPWDTVELRLAYNRYSPFDTPVSFPVK